MSKIFGTKKHIIALLKKSNMNTTQLSKELNLSKATISQHIYELERMGLIHQIDNSHFKRVKYYKLAPVSNGPLTNSAMQILGIIVLFTVVLSLFFFSFNYKGNYSTNTITQINAISNQTPIPINSNATITVALNSSPNTTMIHIQSYACPFLSFYSSSNPANT